MLTSSSEKDELPLPKPYESTTSVMQASPLSIANEQQQPATTVSNHTPIGENADSIRMDIAADAIAFLSHPSQSDTNHSLASRMAFLTRQGVRPAEIDFALRHLPPSVISASGVAGEWSRLVREDVPRWIYWGSLFLGGVGAASCYLEWPRLKEAAEQKYAAARDFLGLFFGAPDAPSQEELHREQLEAMRGAMEAMQRELGELRGQVTYLQARQQIFIDNGLYEDKQFDIKSLLPDEAEDEYKPAADE